MQQKISGTIAMSGYSGGLGTLEIAQYWSSGQSDPPTLNMRAEIKMENQFSPRRHGDTENSQDRGKPKTFTTEDTKEHRGKPKLTTEARTKIG
jgi:hypothetical protein